MIVPGGGFSPDGNSWISCRPNFLLAVPVLSRLFRRLFLQKLVVAHAAGDLQFFGKHAKLADAKAFRAYLAPLRKPNGTSTASVHSADPRKCCAISPATLTGSPSPTGG